MSIEPDDWEWWWGALKERIRCGMFSCVSCFSRRRSRAHFIQDLNKHLHVSRREDAVDTLVI
jgi:hypothetical protein